MNGLQFGLSYRPTATAGTVLHLAGRSLLAYLTEKKTEHMSGHEFIASAHHVVIVTPLGRCQPVSPAAWLRGRLN